MVLANAAKAQTFLRPLNKLHSNMASRGCEITPTQRSVAARLRSKSFDGGFRDDSLRSAIRISVFPRNAVMEKNVNHEKISQLVV